MPVNSCSSNNTKANFSGHVIITTIIKYLPFLFCRSASKNFMSAWLQKGQKRKSSEFTQDEKPEVDEKKIKTETPDS